MNCDKWEEQIWLFHELETEQQALVKQHILTCQACENIWRQTETLRQHLSGLESPQPVHAAALTHRVMSAIPATQPNAPRKMWESWKYALHLVSVLLIFFFVKEHLPEDRPWTNRMPSRKEVALHTASFFKSYYERRKHDRQTSLYARYQNHKKTSDEYTSRK